MKKISSDALRNVPVVGTLLVVVALGALGLAYWGNVTGRERYLQSRNFRLLSDVAEQTQAMLYDSEQIVRRSIRIAGGGISTKPLNKETAALWSSKINDDLQSKRQSRVGKENEAPADRRIAPIELWRGEATIETSAASVDAIVKQFKGYRTSVLGVGSDLRFQWTMPELPNVSFQLPAAALFAGAFNQAHWDRAFSTMALATPDGRVVFAVGAQAAELRASSVVSLLPQATEKEGPNLVRFASAIADEPVRIAGIDYRMFTQPCCGASTPTPAANASPSGLVVIGLADAEALRSLSLAISPLLVLSGVAFVMACLVGWSFLKCSLMGVQQRLRRHDVINLLGSGLFGVGLATILLLTIGAYARLSADVDTHLQHIAAKLNDNFTVEIESATEQLQKMVKAVREDVDKCSTLTGSPPVSGRLPNDPCQKVAAPWSDPKQLVDLSYPDFITFAMVDKSGLQAVKAAFSTATATIVDVNARSYYQRALTHEQLWQLPLPNRPDRAAERLCPDGCYLEYISAWNTGWPQVVISMPTAIPRLPVATLSIPMHALLEPVLPPGFEFAVVDSGGIVQFHSDRQRNGQENLLLETDQNSRLRSLVVARSSGTFNTMYWGYPYRAHVRPTRIPGWSIVTFQAKQTSRALVLEWFTVAMLLTGLYTVGWIVLMLLSLRRGAAWLWPDPLRRHWYVPLGCLAVAATGTWLAIAVSQPVGVTAIAGVVIPVFTWAVVYVVLAVRPAGAGEVKQWTEMCRNYRFAGTAIFLLTAAVPAASFYALSFDRHIEAFVKERQIALAGRINGVVACNDVEKPSEHVVRYDDQDHDGTITCTRDAQADPPSAFGSYLHEAFEDSVPYFTSASIALRELMHEKSDDGTWFSHRIGNREMTLQFRSEDPVSRVEVTTALPAMADFRGTGKDANIVLIAVVALLLLAAVVAAAYFVIAFVLQRVLLADVVEPIRRRQRIVTQVGQHLQVICSEPSWMAAHVYDLHLLRVTPAASGPNARTLDDIKDEVSKVPASQRIGIADFEGMPDDGPLLEKKLEIVEALMDLPNQTVLLFTTRTTSDLDAWIRERCESSPERDRWSRLISRFRVTELPPRYETTMTERWTQYSRNLLQGWREEFMLRWQDWRAPLRWRARLLETEGQSDSKVDEIATELQKSPAFVSGSLTRDQILEEIEESADERYREIWDARTEDERVLLEHVARHNLASAASRRVVRKLLAAGLLRKDPELRLMSESFKRFVLEPERRREVAALEKQAAPSLWDRLRIPLAMSGTLALLFLIVTQREALDTTVSMAIGVTTAVPTLVKLANVLAQLGMKSESKENA